MGLIDDTFKADGLLAKLFPGYEPRKGQIDMAKAVSKAYEETSTLLVEAPTGVGKSVGYLVPAIEAAQTGKVTLVVTSSIVLQEQLISKDLPTLKKVINKPFSFALAKGVNNYLCENAIDSKPKLYTAKEKDEWHTVMEWARSTTTGDISELPFELSYAVRQACTVSSDECLGRNCPSVSSCFYYAAKSSWQTAKIIVTNYHLFFIDLKIRQMSTDGKGILPDYDAVVFDEAHKAPSIARDFFGFRHTEAGIMSIAKATPNEKICEDLKTSATVFFAQLEKYYNSSSYRARIKVENCIPEGTKLAGLLMMAADSFTAEANLRDDNEVKHKLRLRARSAKKAGDDILAAMTMEDQFSVYFIDKTDKSIAISSKLVVVAAVMKRFFGNKPIILTSATLANGKGEFSLIKRELGISDCKELVVESPFDFSKAMFVVPDMPETNSFGYSKAVAQAVEKAVRASQGRALCLFTSWSVLKSTYEHLQCLNLPWMILKQGDAPRTLLIQKFKEDTHSILLGVESFWAGVDVPGEALSCVVIDKLPFISPDDPVLDFLQEKFPDAAFQMFSIPNAIIAMKQGVGRLIRSKSDRGVIVALDNRLFTKSYGKQFLRALPNGIGFSDDISSIAQFLAV
ncbi:MAG: ATP-dependent DNA helicase [Patescibacteria group bacterium]|nr:ATP-dependent DNA helicase [Patescibacteria group bacterium]